MRYVIGLIVLALLPLPASGQLIAEIDGRSTLVSKVDGPEDNPAYFTQRVKRNLSLVYENLKSEIPLCLYGRSDSAKVVVNRVDFPTISTSTDSSTTYEDRRCQAQDDFLGFVHNHDAYGVGCRPSGRDLARFALDSQSMIEVIACPFLRETKFVVLVKDQAKP
jgi:hypothetical protein